MFIILCTFPYDKLKESGYRIYLFIMHISSNTPCSGVPHPDLIRVNKYDQQCVLTICIG